MSFRLFIYGYFPKLAISWCWWEDVTHHQLKPSLECMEGKWKWFRVNCFIIATSLLHLIMRCPESKDSSIPVLSFEACLTFWTCFCFSFRLSFEALELSCHHLSSYRDRLLATRAELCNDTTTLRLKMQAFRAGFTELLARGNHRLRHGTGVRCGMKGNEDMTFRRCAALSDIYTQALRTLLSCFCCNCWISCNVLLSSPRVLSNRRTLDR